MHDGPDKGGLSMYAIPMTLDTDHPEQPEILYTCAGDVWAVLHDDCAAATHSIIMEQYIMADDEEGRRFADLFMRKAREGVSVRLILDAVGSHTMRGSQTLAAMEAAGVAVKFYNHIHLGKLFRPLKWLPRNHCKNIVIDGKIAYIGSACIEAQMHDWREAHLRATQYIVDDIARDFEALWRRMEAGKRLIINASTPSGKKGAEGPLQYISSRGLLRRANPLYKELRRRIHQADGHIYLVTPYFMPPFRLRRALKKASKRGVDVRIMLGEKSDVRIADWLARLYYPRLLRSGVKIYHYRPTILHAKYAVIDDWATVGSTNWDYLSLLRNREANVIVSDEGMIGTLRDLFVRDVNDSKERHVSHYRRLTLISDVLFAIKKALFGNA